MPNNLLIVESPGKIKNPRGEDGLRVIKGLRAAAGQVKTVVVATNPDREGETIAWHIQQALRLKNPQRVVYSLITPAAVRAVIASQQRSGYRRG